jgi:hypothetical protein
LEKALGFTHYSHNTHGQFAVAPLEGYGRPDFNLQIEPSTIDAIPAQKPRLAPTGLKVK